ncbi:MAG: hypothetical protein ACOX7R_13535 [Acetivibrionales bacterium]
MTGIIFRYKVILVILALIIFALLAWLILPRQNLDKIPSRGVFVCDFKKPELEQS